MSASIQRMNELKQRREDLEKEVTELTDVLETQKGVGLDGPLIDNEGFPRNDIDVYSVRHARHNIICLQNDHKEVMKEIEELLYQIHAEARDKQTNEAMDISVHKTVREQEPFVKVDRLDPGSPAFDGGIQVGDEIIKFGSVEKENFTGLPCIGTVVQHSKGKPLNITVLRDGEIVKLTVKPDKWSGRGLLGCNVVPIKR
ncbi:hypothetical protein LOTGIDRAFT_182313 [Lottia gigantea]|uniref:26S proteasome non-ATPase regulatory subunit 9 n=1 Tax=Lottia gigantea TaxID=225164 RepID=V4AFJ9_LOTGI|nr:hypothetical protein LOTGIDRAFT_182313 [Lottia gigantea]ESO93880.1 hypothetical protein LOTGIDRAFT_182313 [Lottia gigantea]